jgi:hypothetical protein
MTTKKPKLPIIPFASPEAREAWLEEHHTTSDGLCLKWWVMNKCIYRRNLNDGSDLGCNAHHHGQGCTSKLRRRNVAKQLVH